MLSVTSLLWLQPLFYHNVQNHSPLIQTSEVPSQSASDLVCMCFYISKKGHHTLCVSSNKWSFWVGIMINFKTNAVRSWLTGRVNILKWIRKTNYVVTFIYGRWSTLSCDFGDRKWDSGTASVQFFFSFFPLLVCFEWMSVHIICSCYLWCYVTLKHYLSEALTSPGPRLSFLACYKGIKLKQKDYYYWRSISEPIFPCLEMVAGIFAQKFF